MDRIRPCGRCGRATRPQRTTLVDHPGTIVRTTADLCATCYDRDYRQGVMRRKPEKPTKNASPTCVRCGFERKYTGSNLSPLCRDCRSVLSKAEQKAWTA